MHRFYNCNHILNTLCFSVLKVIMTHRFFLIHYCLQRQMYSCIVKTAVKYYFFIRILCTNHHFDKTVCWLGPFSHLIWQILEGCPVGEGKKEEDSVHLFLTGLEERKKKKNQILNQITLLSVFFFLFMPVNSSQLCIASNLIHTGSKWSNLHKAFSPQSHNCRRKKSTLPFSLSFTGQYTTVVWIPSTASKTWQERLKAENSKCFQRVVKKKKKDQWCKSNLPVVSWCTLGIFRPARRAARAVFPTPLLPEMKTL